MDDFATRINVLTCLHRNIVLETSGAMHFSAGEVWDDIQEMLLCLDCMEYVTEVEVRSTQYDSFPKLNLTTPMEVPNDHA